ncbi:hypothetical protein VTK26DRAFT_5154 [Humicola hyalothermophila]
MTSLAPAAPISGSVDDAGITSQHAGRGAGVVLTFSEAPGDAVQSQPSTQEQQHEQGASGVPHTSPPPSQQPNLQRPSAAPPPTTTPPNPAPVVTHRSRKPSPGLAARLKALGFGTRKSSSPPPSHHHDVGRLPEEQLRKLDQGHLASSANPVIERRGRPWKGAIARIPSRSSLKSSKSHEKLEPGELVNEPSIAAPTQEFLPEIPSAEPLEMDTNKYILPDHTNGNGVKAQPETRGAHLARDTRPPDADETPPPPLPKDTPPLTRRATNPTTPTSRDGFNPDSVTFNPLGLQRPGSIYTLSRASFANQLAQLTSIQLPDAESLSSKVSAIPTAQAATKALLGAADQIRGWIYKASEVIGGLESDDDVEWAAAGGREGVEEVENAITRFEELIKVYVGAIEELQAREDIAQVSPDDLRRAVAQMESILEEWAKMRNTLHSVKAQVEIAMEWEELWNMVLGDIQNEMDELVRLVFEMEERRHKTIVAATSGDGVDIGDLETIVDDTPRAPPRLHTTNPRFSVSALPVSPTSPSPNATSLPPDDSSLLALFARMQPLRASLDFLPMRLSVFEARAESIFPTACEELEVRRTELDISYKKLEKDAESLRKELGEDRWVLVFRGAARQAQKMYESVERSVTRLREAIDSGMHLTNQPIMSKKLENYEGKKTHYGPAIERVLSIIDKGVKDRLTVNGEILRLHAEMQAKWEELKESMSDLDAMLEELQADRREQQLRDSVSSMLSTEFSTLASGHETPQSSPPSSVVMSSVGMSSSSNLHPSRARSPSALGQPSKPASRRQSSLPTPASKLTRKPVASSKSTLTVPSRDGSATPTGNRSSRPASSLATRPRWNSSVNTSDIDTGHNFKPLTLTTPSPYAKKPVPPARSVSATTSSASKLPTLRTPLVRAASESPMPEDNISPKPSGSRLSFRERLAAQGPPSSSSPSVLKPRLASQFSASSPAPSSSSSSTQAKPNTNASFASRRASLQPPKPPLDFSAPDAPPRQRPASSLAASRRSSMLPVPRPALGASNRTASVGGSGGSSTGGGATGRESPQAVAGARFAMRKGSSGSAASASAPGGNGAGSGLNARPRWRN